MKLSEMSQASNKRVSKFMESRFGFSIDFDKLSVAKATRLSETINQNLATIRQSVNAHTAEKNPRYMELLTVQESLGRWLADQRRQLTEGEVGNAEVLLAAKDMVDSVQQTIERVGKMQNEQLPQLLDSIRDQIGAEQADSFKNSVGTTLQTLMTQLQTAREGIDNGVRILSGEQVDNPMAIPGDTAPAGDTEIPPMPNSEFDQDETDGFGATDAAVGGDEHLGRELR